MAFETLSLEYVTYMRHMHHRSRVYVSHSCHMVQPVAVVLEYLLAGLFNQLHRCRFNPRIACLENTDTAIVGDWWTGMGGHHA